MCFVTGYTRLFGKRADGSFPAERQLLFWPWMYYARMSARVYRRFHPQAAAHEVHPGWWLGGWPKPGDIPEDTAILDMTCELPRRVPGPYRCVPTWDGTAPAKQPLLEAVQWLVEQRQSGRPVLVHCAHGRARSTTALVLALVAAGLHPDTRAAYAHVRAIRDVRLTPEQRRLLDSIAVEALAAGTAS